MIKTHEVFPVACPRLFRFLIGALLSGVLVIGGTTWLLVGRSTTRLGAVPLVRTFNPRMPLPWDAPRNRVVAGRDVVTSFRPMPQDVMSGSYDDDFEPGSRRPRQTR